MSFTDSYFFYSDAFAKVFLQKCFIFKEIHGKDWHIQASDKEDYTTELNKNSQNSKEKKDEFIKLLTKDQDQQELIILD